MIIILFFSFLHTGTLHQGLPAQGSCDVFLSFKKWLYLNQKVQKAHLTKGILQL